MVGVETTPGSGVLMTLIQMADEMRNNKVKLLGRVSGGGAVILWTELGEPVSLDDDVWIVDSGGECMMRYRS